MISATVVCAFYPTVQHLKMSGNIAIKRFG